MRVVVTLSTALAISVAAPAFSSAADYSYRTIAASSDALSLGQCPAINNLGAVAFPASEFDPDTGDSQDLILRGSGGALTTIADEADGFTSISGNPSINDLGAVAFDGNPVGPDGELIARGSGGRLTEIARAGGAQRFDSFTADVSVNVLGRVAFTGELNATGDEGLFEGSGGPIATRYLASTSPLAGSIAPPSLTDLESAAFAEETDAGASGIFRQDLGGRVTLIGDAVIRTGDTVAGRTVQSVTACREMLNLRGQVAAKVTFDDFTEAIIRATPR